MNETRLRRPVRLLGSKFPALSIVLAAAVASCSAKESGFSQGSGQNAAGSGTAASSGTGGVPIGSAGGLSVIPTMTPTADDSGVNYDASLAPPVENPTKVAGKSYADLPAAPVLDTQGGTAPPANAAALFGGAGGAQTGGPCLIEPETGALYPRNWLRPSFRWVAPASENLFEVRLHVANQAHDLVVYTTRNLWTMPKDMWTSLHEDSYDEPMTVTVRGGALNGGALTGVSAGSTASMAIAPVPAPGSIVYWTTTNGTALKGFRIGDEVVETVLMPPQVQQPAATTCVGCHTATPDGQFASFSILPGAWPNALANIQPGQAGAPAPWLGAGASAFLASDTLGINTFSKAHWTPGDRIEISMYKEQSSLVWIDLEAAQMAGAWGKIALTGDPQASAGAAGAPSWSHDGKTIAYVSLAKTTTGRLEGGPADIYTVAYNNKQGGNATPVAGASDPGANEYYPAFTPDDKFIVFSKTTGNATTKSLYNNAGAEVDIVATGGGAATRLVANDPPSCTTQASPGVTNSWPKTAPEVGAAKNGRLFYWVIFSSRRDPFAQMKPQLYVAGVVVDAAGKMTTSSALYLWNQPENEANHTPAWENFKIQYIPPTSIGPR